MAGSDSFVSSSGYSRSGQLVLTGLSLACAALLLASCGNSGPSRSEAAEAIKRQASSDMAAAFPDAQITVEVDDLKCTKAGDDVFDCQVLMTATGPGGTKQSATEMQFTRLGGEWHVRPKSG